MKIIKKCLTQIASEASYIYILSGQKFIRNAKKSQFGDFLKMELAIKQCFQTKIGEKDQNWKIQMRHFE